MGYKRKRGVKSKGTIWGPAGSVDHLLLSRGDLGRGAKCDENSWYQGDWTQADARAVSGWFPRQHWTGHLSSHPVD